MLRFGISQLPPDGDDGAFLDSLVASGHTAFEVAFVDGFPWKTDRCRRFGELAAERGIALSLHAPYFAVLTVEEGDRRQRVLAALEHSLKLAKALGSRIICAHTGYSGGRPAEMLIELALDGLRTIAPKVTDLGVLLGLETSGTERGFGSLGDIALLAAEFPFVSPVVDWAHVHALSGGKLTTPEAFGAVITFLRAEFPAWKIEPLHTQFTDNLFGPKGEIKHVPYGEGSLRITPLVEAATAAGLAMTVISEAHEQSSHQAIFTEFQAAVTASQQLSSEARVLGSGRVAFPDPVHITRQSRVVGARHPLKLSNADKQFFPEGFTKGDLVQYYASVSGYLLPHLAQRAIVLARFPNGATGDFFYEKEAPSHKPEWLVTAPLHSEVRQASINFCTAPDRESLMWIANLGCIEIHPWLSQIANRGNPDFAIFDLDPAKGASWEQVVEVARLVELVLKKTGLRSYPKTSGATGLHIYVPIDPVYPYQRVRKFVETAGRLIASANPDSATMEWDIPKRAGKVFIDHNQNVEGKTIASVYSVRPFPGPPVSTPIRWEELETVKPGDFTIATIWDRLGKTGDLFRPVLAGGQRLEEAETALGLG